MIKVSSFAFKAARTEINSQISDFISSVPLRHNQTKQDE